VKQTALEIKRGRRECRMRVAPVAACAEIEFYAHAIFGTSASIGYRAN
jgi:hypothetical protein